MVRSMVIRKARKEDIDNIHVIVRYYAERDILLARTKEDIAGALDTFLVAEEDESFKGVISYYDYGEKLKEIRSLAVKPDAERTGVGKSLVSSLVERLRERCGDPKIFVLTYSPGFFEKTGFISVDKSTLPEKIWKDCQNCAHRDNCGETALVYQPV